MLAPSVPKPPSPTENHASVISETPTVSSRRANGDYDSYYGASPTSSASSRHHTSRSIHTISSDSSRPFDEPKTRPSRSFADDLESDDNDSAVAESVPSCHAQMTGMPPPPPPPPPRPVQPPVSDGLPTIYPASSLRSVPSAGPSPRRIGTTSPAGSVLRNSFSGMGSSSPVASNLSPRRVTFHPESVRNERSGEEDGTDSDASDASSIDSTDPNSLGHITNLVDSLHAGAADHSSTRSKNVRPTVTMAESDGYDGDADDREEEEDDEAGPVSPRLYRYGEVVRPRNSPVSKHTNARSMPSLADACTSEEESRVTNGLMPSEDEDSVENDESDYFETLDDDVDPDILNSLGGFIDSLQQAKEAKEAGVTGGKPEEGLLVDHEPDDMSDAPSLLQGEGTSLPVDGALLSDIGNFIDMLNRQKKTQEEANKSLRQNNKQEEKETKEQKEQALALDAKIVQPPENQEEEVSVPEDRVSDNDRADDSSDSEASTDNDSEDWTGESTASGDSRPSLVGITSTMTGESGSISDNLMVDIGAIIDKLQPKKVLQEVSPEVETQEEQMQVMCPAGPHEVPLPNRAATPTSVLYVSSNSTFDTAELLSPLADSSEQHAQPNQLCEKELIVVPGANAEVLDQIRAFVASCWVESTEEPTVYVRLRATRATADVCLRLMPQETEALKKDLEDKREARVLKIAVREVDEDEPLQYDLKVLGDAISVPLPLGSSEEDVTYVDKALTEAKVCYPPWPAKSLLEMAALAPLPPPFHSEEEEEENEPFDCTTNSKVPMSATYVVTHALSAVLVAPFPPIFPKTLLAMAIVTHLPSEEGIASACDLVESPRTVAFDNAGEVLYLTEKETEELMSSFIVMREEEQVKTHAPQERRTQEGPPCLIDISEQSLTDAFLQNDSSCKLDSKEKATTTVSKGVPPNVTVLTPDEIHHILSREDPDAHFHVTSKNLREKLRSHQTVSLADVQALSPREIRKLLSNESDLPLASSSSTSYYDVYGSSSIALQDTEEDCPQEDKMSTAFSTTAFFATDLRPVDEARKRQQEESLVVQTSDDLPSPQNQLKISKVVEILSGLDDEKNTKILINHGCEGVDVSNFVPYGQPPSDQQRLHGLPSNSASSELGVEMGPDNLSASRMLQSLPASPILKDTLSDVSPNMAQSLPASPINGLDDLPTTPLETCKDLQNSASKVLINGAPPFKAFKKRRSTKVSQVSNGIARSYSTGGFPTPKEDVSVPDSEEHETYLADLQPILRTNSNVSTRSLMSMKSTRSLPVTSSRTLRLGSVLEPRSREDLTEVSPPRTTRMGSVLIPNSRVQGGIVALEEISPSHEKKLGSLLKPSQNLKKDKVPFSPRIGSLLVPPTQASTSESFSVDVCKAQKLGSMLVPPPCDEVEVEIENHLHHIDTIEKENQIRSLLPKVQSVTTRTGRSASRTTAYVQSDNVSQFEKRFQERERRILENNDEYFMIDRWTSPWRHTDHELASKLEQREKRQNFLSNNYVLKTKGINAVEVASTFRKRIRANRPYPNITQQWKISFEERSAGHSGFYDLDYIEFYEATVTGTVGNLLDKIPWEHRNVPRNFFRSYEQSNFFGSIIRRRLSKRIFQPVCHPKSMLMPMEDAIPEDGEWLEDWYTTWEAKRSDTNNLVKHFDNDYDDKTLFSSMTGSTSIPSTLGGGTSASVSRMTSSSGPGSRVSGSVAFGIMSSLEDSTEIIADIQKLDPPEVGTLNTVRLAIGESSSRVTWEYTSSLRKSRWRRKFFPRNTFPY